MTTLPRPLRPLTAAARRRRSQPAAAFTPVAADASVLTLVRGRRDHLNNLLRGIARSHTRPREVVVVHMNEPATGGLIDPGVPLRRYTLNDRSHGLPLAAARNLAARRARGSVLAFLDVDCIPSPTYLGTLLTHLKAERSLAMGEARYLEPGANEEGWSFDALRDASRRHPRRPRIDPGERVPSEAYHLFWSLCFAIHRDDYFDRVGGFDPEFVGYGGEDTDFAFRARRAKLPFVLSGAVAYHQHHDTCSPPYPHLEDIVTNARVFHRRWGVWPMEGWLRAFQEQGLIRWTHDALELIDRPDSATVAAARSPDPFA